MRYVVAAFLCGIVLGTALPVAAEPVGLVQKIQNTAYGTPPAGSRAPKQPRDAVEFNERIETASDSAIEIGFVDGSSLTVGAQTDILIDSFVFDSDTEDGQALVTLSRGAFRWVTGVLPAQNIRIDTPTATIALRGTTLLIGVRPNGNSIIALLSGLLTVTPKGGGAPVDLVAGQSALVSPGGVEVLDQIVSVADAIVDGGWRNATNLQRNRGGDSRSGGSSNHD